MIKVKVIGKPYMRHPVGSIMELDGRFSKVLLLLNRVVLVEGDDYTVDGDVVTLMNAPRGPVNMEIEPVRKKRKYTRRDMRAES